MIKEVVQIYNHRSGNGEAGKLISKHRSESSSTLTPPITSIEINELTDEQLRAFGNIPTLLAVYGGDGTSFAVARAVWKLAAEKKVDPQQFVLAFMGHPIVGGERVGANVLGTDKKSLLKIIENAPNSVISLVPWTISDNEQTLPFWWLASKGNGLLKQILESVETQRKNNVKTHQVRVLKMIVDIFQNLKMENNISVSINNRKYSSSLSDAFLLVPPFLSLSRINFDRLSTLPILLTLSSNERSRYEFIIQLLLDIVSLSYLGKSISPNLKMRKIQATDRIEITGEKTNNVDSEIIPTKKTVEIIHNNKLPSVNFVKLNPDG